MFDRNIAKYALSLTWRFMICFVVLSYPVFTHLKATMEAITSSSEQMESNLMIATIVMANLLIPFVIPFLSMYGALAWYSTRKKSVKA